MKPYARQASILWLGTRGRGQEVVTVRASGVHLALRRPGADLKGPGTDPPGLMAAAHAGSFTLSLANELAEAGYRPRQIDTTATVTLENRSAGWTVTQIDLEVIAAVPKVAECEFVDAALRAKANCPISRALTANISMRARLAPAAPLPTVKEGRKRGATRPARSGKRGSRSAPQQPL